MLGGIAAVLIVSGVMWLRGGRYVSTDDAYVRGAKLMVSTDVSGIVASIDVKQGQRVKAGDVLFRLDDRQFRNALEQARAQLAQTKLNVEALRQDYKRIQEDIATEAALVDLARSAFERAQTLARSNFGTRAQLDQTRYTLAAEESKLASLKQQAAVALVRLGGNLDTPIANNPQVMQAQAQTDEAQRMFDRAVVRAPFNGIVTAVEQLQVGTYLVSQTAALTNTGAVGLVSEERVWIDANIKETDLTYVRPGNHVSFTVDAYPRHEWSGHVDTIYPATGAEFSILPAQNAGGNWVKIVQRLPVRIAIDRSPDDPPLRSGMSVVVDIDTEHTRSISDMWHLVGLGSRTASPETRAEKR
ncbi:MAG: hemolysin secretion protein D [Rhizobiales bacterium 62-17]|nr:MAG: hemolysin secretion protein D [Rhizobiales bacterium 62-17]